MSREKFFNNLLQVFLVCLGILGLIIAVRQVTMVLVTNSLHKVAETDHFIFFATDRDEALYTSGFLRKCELIYDRIAHDINYHPDIKIVHRMFPSMRLLHLSRGNPFEWPADSIGRSSKFEFRELSPFSADWLKYSQMNFDMLFSHELTHILTDEINPDKRQNWLMEGLAVYEQFHGNARAYVRPKIHEHVVQGLEFHRRTWLRLWLHSDRVCC